MVGSSYLQDDVVDIANDVRSRGIERYASSRQLAQNELLLGDCVVCHVCSLDVWRCEARRLKLLSSRRLSAVVDFFAIVIASLQVRVVLSTVELDTRKTGGSADIYTGTSQICTQFRQRWQQ